MLAGDVHSTDQSTQMAYFTQVSWCDRITTLGLQAARPGLGFCPSISKSAQTLTFPSCRLVYYGLYRCHSYKLSDVSACCTFLSGKSVVLRKRKQWAAPREEGKIGFNPNWNYFFPFIFFNPHEWKFWEYSFLETLKQAFLAWNSSPESQAAQWNWALSNWRLLIAILSL